jgi:glycosyltransferase involved in cell wall biosynthesis
MRILVLIHEYPPVGGGGGRVAQDICHGLAGRGHELLVLTARCDDLPAREVQDGVTVLRLDSGRREAFRADLRAMGGYVLRTLWEGPGLLRNWKPDVIHVHFAVPAGAAALGLSRLSGVPYVLTPTWATCPGACREKTGKWFRLIYPFTPPIWRGAARVVAVSEFTRSLAGRHYPVPVEVIYNGVDLQQLDPGEIRLNDPPQVVFAGRFMAQKNPLQVVRSLAELRALPWQAVLLGDGPCAARWRPRWPAAAGRAHPPAGLGHARSRAGLLPAQ